MNNKKGFTLIELLAVIVILAVIALIVTPIVTGIIAQAKESANARSIEGHVTDVNYAILSLTLANGTDMSTYDVTPIGTISGAVTQKVTETNSADTVSCTQYNIVSGQVVEATGCKVSGSTSTYSYKNSEGAKLTSK